MDLILHNGIIHTMNGSEVVSAIAIKGGLVAGVGCDAEILSRKTAQTTVVDLGNKLVVPGFNDSHLHILGYGLGQRRLNLIGSKSIEEIIAKGQNYLRQNPGVQVLFGRGWNQDHLLGHALPTRRDLDKISKQLPIVFYRVCGHIAVINSKALEIFGITENTIPPEGGSFDRETGLFCEDALDLFQPPAPGVAEMKEILAEATGDMLKKGITSAQSDDFGCAAYKDVIAAYAGLSRDGELPVRIYQQCLFNNMAEISRFFAESHTFPADTPYYKLGPIKLLTDGSLGARTALLSRPYHDDNSTRGIPCFTQTELDEIAAFCQEKGRALAIHCIGDGSLYMATQSVEKAQKAFGGRPRHGIVHCQISDARLLKKLKELNLLVYIQPIFLDYDIHIVEQRVGRELAQTSYNFKTLCDLGLNVSLGTDCPVEGFDPFNNIYCAVTRKDLRGFPEGGFYPEQAMSVHQAVYCYTVGSAYCSYEENVKGKLAPGFFADMAVIDKNIFNIAPAEIKDARVEMTIVSGKIVYVRE